MIQTVKVSFEVTSNWDREEFREFMNEIRHTDNLELWIISTNPDLAMLYVVADALNISHQRVIQCADNTAKKTQIINTSMTFHFDNDSTFASDIRETTSTKGIYVSKFYNFYELRMKYIDTFQRELKIILKDDTEAC